MLSKYSCLKPYQIKDPEILKFECVLIGITGFGTSEKSHIPGEGREEVVKALLQAVLLKSDVISDSSGPVRGPGEQALQGSLVLSRNPCMRQGSVSWQSRRNRVS